MDDVDVILIVLLFSFVVFLRVAFSEFVFGWEQLN